MAAASRTWDDSHAGGRPSRFYQMIDNLISAHEDEVAEARERLKRLSRFPKETSKLETRRDARRDTEGLERPIMGAQSMRGSLVSMDAKVGGTTVSMDSKVNKVMLSKCTLVLDNTETEDSGAVDVAEKQKQIQEEDEIDREELAEYLEGIKRTCDMRPCWQRRSTTKDSGLAGDRKQAQIRETSTTENRQLSVELPIRPEARRPGLAGCYSRLKLIPPFSAKRLTWDLVGATLICYDTIMVPFALAFSPEQVSFLTFMDFLTMIWWTIDIPATFVTGYFDKGTVVMDPFKVAKHYVCTWLFLDVLIVSADWAYQLGAAKGGGEVSSLARTLRAVRAVRVLRLLRLFKLQRLLTEMQDRISSEHTYLIVNLGKMMAFILTFNHCIACLWFFVGMQGVNSGYENWVHRNYMLERSLAYRYTTSMHWTLTQFTPASMEVMPQNVMERTMAVIVLVFSLVSFSSFVGSITASMTALRNMNSDQAKEFWSLRRYLKQNSVSRRTSRRIVRFLEFVCKANQERVQRRDVHILALLSPGLTEELEVELNSPILITHPLFAFMHLEMPSLLVNTCHDNIQRVLIGIGETIFYPSESATCMYIFLRGSVMYTSPMGVLDPPVQEMECVSEMALWSQWIHPGRLDASSESEFMTVGSRDFAELISQYSDAWHVVSSYAKMFIKKTTELWFDNSEEFVYEAPRLTDIVRNNNVKEACSDVLEELISARGSKLATASSSLIALSKSASAIRLTAGKDRDSKMANPIVPESSSGDSDDFQAQARENGTARLANRFVSTTGLDAQTQDR